MSRTWLAAVVVLLLAASSALGFDGVRKGFVLGGGLGITPNAHWEVNADFFGYDIGSADEDRAGVAVQFIIGGAFDEKNMLVYEGNMSGFNSELLDESTIQGFNGASWYHYFGPTGKSWFSALGLGLCYFKVGDYEETDPGAALLLGGGYEFSPHWQVGAYLNFGKTSDSAFNIDADFKHYNISILVSGIAF